MGILKDIIIAIPIGVVYNFIVNRAINVSFGQMAYSEKYQKSLIFMFVIGLIGMILAFTLFKNHPMFKNRPLRMGLIFGSSILIFYSMITNWEKMDDITKIIMFGIILISLVWYSYYSEDEKKDKQKVKKNNN